jgi:hypothetical protein
LNKLQLTDTCIKRWGLRASSLSAVAKADAGQNTLCNHLTPNALYMMLCLVFVLNHLIIKLFQYSKESHNINQVSDYNQGYKYNPANPGGGTFR